MSQNGARFVYAGLIAACVISGLMMWFGYQAFLVLEGKAEAQGREAEAVEKFVRGRAGLESVQKNFRASFPSATKLTDWRGVIAAVNFPDAGLEVDADALSVSLSPVPGSEAEGLGLYRACVSNQGGELLVKAKSYQELFKGVEKMLNRADIHAETIMIDGNGQTPQARIATLCLLFRTDLEEDKK